jgi:sugar/nucleoside kinase (ribokinase family)
VSSKNPLRFFSRPDKRDFVLVAGAAHLDVIADYRAENQSRLDKIGQVRYAVGGTGYNITINLGQAGVPVAFLTLLKKNSFSSTWIRERLESTRVNTEFVELSERISESGFIAIRQDGQLETAVTSSAIGEHAFLPATVDEAVQRARFVVMDCNLAVDQMSLLLDSAMRHGKPVAVAAVSDSKVLRLLELGDHQPIDLVSLADHELTAVFDGRREDDPAVICERLKAKQVIITGGANGYVVVTAAGGIKRFSAPQVDNIVSTTGAGDALFAAALSDWYKHQNLDLDNSVPNIATAIRKVLQQPGATVGSVATDIDFAHLATIAVRDTPIWRRALSAEVATAAAVIGLILTGVLTWLTYKLLPNSPDFPSTPASLPSASQQALPAPQRGPTP